MRAVLAIAGKDLRLLLRDKMGLFWVLIFPLLIAMFFGVISGGGGARGAISVAVDDQDGTPAAKLMVEALEADPALAVRRLPREAARELVRRGELTAYILVQDGFGRGGLLVRPEGAPEPALEIGVDPARKAEAAMLEGLVQRAAFAALARPDPDATALFERMHAPAIEIAPVMRDAARPASAFEVTFPSGIMWGIIGCIATFAISVVVEREKGTLLRLRVAPIGHAHLLAGKGLACFAACVAVIVVLIGLARVVFGLRVQAPALLAAGALCTALCFTGIMMLLSVLGRTERAVAGASWGAMMPLSMLGGGMIPLIAMPSWMQALSHVSPVRWGIVALEGAIWRGYDAGEMLLPCAVLLGVGAVSFAAGAWVFAKRD